MSWQQRVAELKPGDVMAVVKTTTRDERCVSYEVDVALHSLDAHAFEEGEDRLCIWSDEVAFGQTDATRAGGAAFKAMAQEQEHVAIEVWRRTRPA